MLGYAGWREPACRFFSCSWRFAEECGGGAPWEVRGYDVEMRVSRNAGVSVTERISVFFSEYSHGLYRTIPTALRMKRIVNGREKEYLYQASGWTTSGCREAASPAKDSRMKAEAF